MKSVEIDRTKRLRDEPHTGHNRWHPNVEPVLEVEVGEDVMLQTRDASDGQVFFGATVQDLSGSARGVVHPLTGPVYIKGAERGDLLEIVHVDIIPEATGWTRINPGLGFLRDVFTTPYLVHWELNDDVAITASLPNVRIPSGCFMGTAGLAPSYEQLKRWTLREADLLAKGGIVLPPDPTDGLMVRIFLSTKMMVQTSEFLKGPK